MRNTLSLQIRTLAYSVVVLSASLVSAAQPTEIRVFATGADVNATGPDSITVGNNSVWVSYTNGADSTGKSGSSTIVQYDLKGNVESKYELAGSVDGLKIEPTSGYVWALQNQDGNPNLTVIDPVTGITPMISYQTHPSGRGYDDVVFTQGRAFLSFTNPNSLNDPTIVEVVKGTNPIAVTPVLTQGASGTNIANSRLNQPTSQNDPDSLKLTPYGDLQLTSGDDGQLIFVHNPGKSNQSVSFIQLLDPSAKPVSGLDDAVFATSEEGIFYLADTNNNRVLAISASDLEVGSLFASVGSLKELGLVNLKTGKVSPFVANLNGPHGLVFVPAKEGENQ